jgi:hypothetical protein
MPWRESERERERRETESARELMRNGTSLTGVTQIHPTIAAWPCESLLYDVVEVSNGARYARDLLSSGREGARGWEGRQDRRGGDGGAEGENNK